MPKLIIDPVKGPYVAEGDAGIDVLAGTTITYIGAVIETVSGTITFASGSTEVYASGSSSTHQSGSVTFFSGSTTFASGSQLTLASGSLAVFASGSQVRASGSVLFASASLLHVQSGSNVNFASGSNSQFFGLKQYQSGSETNFKSGHISVFASDSQVRASGSVLFASASLLKLESGVPFIHDALLEGSHLVRGTLATTAAYKVSGSFQINATDAASQTASGSIMFIASTGPMVGGPMIGIGVTQESLVGQGAWSRTRLTLSGTDSAASKRQIAITLHGTGSTATGGGAVSGIDGNPLADSIYIFTDGSDLFYKQANGTVKKITAV